MFNFFKKKKENPDGLVALPVDELLAPYSNLLNLIHQQVGVPETHWEAVYLQFIKNFAKHVQLLPASESHHHSGAGGLLTHSLEVGLNALKIRKGKVLPVGASSEVLQAQKELWSYAIFTAAMLHDIGKPLTDQIITIVSENPQRVLAPLTETIPEKAVYRVEFRRGRKYRSHENVALLLASKIVPLPGLDWITNNNDVLDDWSFCLTGRKSEANALGELVMQADQISTAKNLTGATNTPLPSAKIIPLAERLKTALIYLIDEGVKLPLDRQGAAGFIHDGKLWLMTKRVLDEIRSHMFDEGQDGIPSDNTRLMDELMQNGIITPSEANRATWKVTVTISNEDGNKWKNDFNLLCCPLSSLWPDPTAWPKQSELINVTPIANDKDNKKPQAETKKLNSTAKTPQNDPPIQIKSTSNDDTSEEQTNKLPSLDDLLQAPPGIQLEKEEKVKEDLKKPAPKNTLTTAKKSKKEEHIDNKKPPEITTSDKDFENKKRTQPNHAQKFVDWFSNGIADGSLPINNATANIHTVGEEKTLLLVSPLLFKLYAKSYPDVNYLQLQNDFCSLGLNKAKKNNTNIWSFKTISDRKKDGKLKGIIIENAEEKLGIRLPPGNYRIEPTA